MTTDLDDVRHQLLIDAITNALDAITLVDNVSEGMDPADVKAAIVTATLRHAAVSKVTH